MRNGNSFTSSALEYDSWFDCHREAFDSEILALRSCMSLQGEGLEIGVGTGRFAMHLSVRHGVEPSMAMAAIAKSRNIEVCIGRAEALLYNSDLFDFALFVTTLCFVDAPVKSLEEGQRVLKIGGRIIIGMIDEDAPPGKSYAEKRASNEFYKEARFYPVDQVIDWLTSLGYVGLVSYQTIFSDVASLSRIDEVRKGHGDGLFVVICARKAGDRYLQ
jgi:ubiquinone/menaquinone biosynthesis C-methylase UbiE